MKYIKLYEDYSLETAEMKDVTIFLGDETIHEKLVNERLYDELNYTVVDFETFKNIFGIDDINLQQYLKDTEVYKFQLNKLYFDIDILMEYSTKTKDEISNELSNLEIVGKDLVFSSAVGVSCSNIDPNNWIVFC
jgi:hypothetical protein